MKLKKIVKMVVLFSMMNLVGSVVWAEPKTGESLEPKDCKQMSDNQDAGKSDVATDKKENAKGKSVKEAD